MPVVHLGIGYPRRVSAKLTFDAALLTAEGKPKHRTFSNDAAWYHSLTDWLGQNRITEPAQIHACLEATGHYGDALALSSLTMRALYHETQRQGSGLVR